MKNDDSDLKSVYKFWDSQTDPFDCVVDHLNFIKILGIENKDYPVIQTHICEVSKLFYWFVRF